MSESTMNVSEFCALAKGLLTDFEEAYKEGIEDNPECFKSHLNFIDWFHTEFPIYLDAEGF